MKKIRYLPFGYTIRNGHTVIEQQEADIVRNIFKAYIQGASLKEIAEDLTAKKIPYTERTCVWDNPMAIWDAKSWIGIDCGCMLPETGDPWSGVLGRLACLRLDDMQVFYSEEPQYGNSKEAEMQHDG